MESRKRARLHALCKFGKSSISEHSSKHLGELSVQRRALDNTHSAHNPLAYIPFPRLSGPLLRFVGGSNRLCIY